MCTTNRFVEQVNDNHCSNGDQDMPAMAFDPTTAIVWIVWRHQGFGDIGNTGACIRGGTVNRTAQTIEWLGDAEDIDNLDRSPFRGVGGLLVQAAFGNVTVMYANTDHDQPCEVDKQVRWFTNTSFNNGIDWSASHEIYNSTNVDWCAFGDTANAKIRDFGFVRDPTGFYWAAVHDSVESIRVFVSEDIGFTWRQVHQVSFFPTRSLFHPTLGADASGRILLSYYASDANDAQIQRMVIAGAGRADPEGWSLNVPASPFFPPSTGFGETIFLGDYDDVTAVDPATYPGANGTFAISWADSTRIPGFEVAAAYVSVPSP